MASRSTLTLAGLMATLALAVAVTPASARNLRVDRNIFRILWTSLEFIETGSTVRCPVTMEGSFHSSTIAKVQRANIGDITRATVTSASCTGGNATILQTNLPWRVTYQGFTGRLPAIATVTEFIINMQVLIRSAMATCLLTTATSEPGAGEIGVAAEGRIQSFRFDSSSTISMIAPNGLFECPTLPGHIGNPAGDGQMTIGGMLGRILLTLI